VIDLTRRLDRGLAIYGDGDYRDPPLVVTPWCAVAERGFRVDAVALGTQTGTHIDAPSHFDPGGDDLDALPIDALIGRYALIDLPAGGDLAAAYRGEPILFVRAPDDGPAAIAPDALAALLALPPRVWVVAGTVAVRGAPPLEFHRALARAGRYLVEELDPDAARAVAPGGELLALPLALVGTSGAPCRVVVRYDAATPK
jgi:arylformamidase